MSREDHGRVDRMLRRIAYNLGVGSARFAPIIILVTLGLSVFLGIYAYQNVVINSQPDQLWVPQNSRSEKEKRYFDEHYGAFYRLEQLMFIPRDRSRTAGLEKDFLLKLWNAQDELANVSATYGAKTLKFQDLCFHPIQGNDGCLLSSVTGYWQDDKSVLENDTDIPKTLGSFQKSSLGIPVELSNVVGGAEFNGSSVVALNGYFSTFMLRNEPATEDEARAWEKAWIAKAKQLHDDPTLPFDVYYWAERSIGDELQRENGRDIHLISISYAVMFVYVSLALGKLDPVRSRFILGLAGVITVVCSVAIAVGICVLFGVHMSPIISEVIPFLILAIGVDNMFFLVNTYNEIQTPELAVEKCMGETLARVGEQIAIASLAEFLAFVVGLRSVMPAMKEFCVYAAAAVAVNFVLQVTTFMSVLSLDNKRQRRGGLDCLPCITRPGLRVAKSGNEKGIVRKFVERRYSPTILSPRGKDLTFIAFGVLLFFGIIGTISLDMGLSQSVAFPEDSELIPFFDLQKTLFTDLGPPLYIVARDMNFSSPEIQLKMADLMSTMESVSTVHSLVSFQDYLTRWVSSCDHNPPKKLLPTGVVPPENYREWLKEFIHTPLNDSCCTGKGICGEPFQMDLDIDETTGDIITGRMRGFFKPAWSSAQYTEAIRTSRAATDSSGLNAYPYSVFIVFFEEYLFLRSETAETLGLAGGVVIVVILLFFRSISYALIVGGTIAMILVDVMGLMSFTGILLNPVSLVNLVLCIGLSVEFCSHLTRSFSKQSGSRDRRMMNALSDTGVSVFSGITVTKILGVCVLGFADSQIFKVYYFRMLLIIIGMGAIHGLVLLPVALATFGPRRGEEEAHDPAETVPMLENTVNEEEREKRPLVSDVEPELYYR